MPEESLTTALHQRHIDTGGVMADCDGWSMPLHYGDPDAEFAEAHGRGVVVDVSHIGRLRIKGNGALGLVERLCTCDAARQEDNTCQKTLLCRDSGDILDLALLTRLEDDWVLTFSPARREAVVEHILAEAPAYDVKVKDTTENTTMLHICGPATTVPALLDSVLPEQVSPLPRRQCRAGSYLVARYVALRCGLTKLWSLEVTLPNMLAGKAWQFITEKAGDKGLKPAGQMTREALRKQASLRTFGTGISERTNPFDEGLVGIVDCTHEFIGRDALEARRNG